ncbi:MAG: hypothetical protein K0U38_09605 [Epsilonproteobacteria bacterium]|nr:hypothetical protein [Campylobacterota bacterium]
MKSNVGCVSQRTKSHENKTTVGRIALIPTQTQITNRFHRSFNVVMQMFFVLSNIGFMRIDVGMRATRPTERHYV